MLGKKCSSIAGMLVHIISYFSCSFKKIPDGSHKRKCLGSQNRSTIYQDGGNVVFRSSINYSDRSLGCWRYCILGPEAEIKSGVQLAFFLVLILFGLGIQLIEWHCLSSE